MATILLWHLRGRLVYLCIYLLALDGFCFLALTKSHPWESLYTQHVSINIEYAMEGGGGEGGDNNWGEEGPFCVHYPPPPTYTHTHTHTLLVNYISSYFLFYGWLYVCMYPTVGCLLLLSLLLLWLLILSFISKLSFYNFFFQITVEWCLGTAVCVAKRYKNSHILMKCIYCTVKSVNVPATPPSLKDPHFYLVTLCVVYLVTLWVVGRGVLTTAICDWSICWYQKLAVYIFRAYYY